MNINKKRAGIVVGGIGTLGAVAALGMGGTSALFTSELGPQENTLVGGTVEVAEGGDSIRLVQESIVPGDAPTAKYSYVYNGVDAFVGMDIAIESTAQNACEALPSDGPVTQATMQSLCNGTGEQPMYNGNPASGSLDLAVVPRNSWASNPLVFQQTLENSTTCTAVSKVITCSTEKENVLVPDGYIDTSNPNTYKYSDGASNYIQVKPSLALNAPDSFQGSTVQIDLKMEAVQFDNNNQTGAIAPGVSVPAQYGVGTTYLLPKAWL